MASFIQRGVNISEIDNVLKMIKTMPHTTMTKKEYEAYVRANGKKENGLFDGEAYITTYSQMARQLGLYYIDNNDIFHPRFERDISPEEAYGYMLNWCKNFTVPHPYMQGFSNIQKPVFLEKTIIEELENNPDETNIQTILKKIFHETEDLNSIDIFCNFIDKYSETLETKNNTTIQINKDKRMDANFERKDNESFFNNLAVKLSKDIKHPHNRIVFGAPGTGKSFEINRDAKEFCDNFERVTFHPNYSYAQFVGTYKPIMKKKEGNQEEEITYSYVPGPFIRVLEKALYSQEQAVKNQTTAEPYLLIIEEINRAIVSAVFGDVFQLLDRNENNESQYEIDVSEDLYNYLTSEDNEETDHKKLNIGKKIKIPSNMFIWATMNSADQGVQPMDAAFKRRWDFEYLPLDKNESLIENYKLPFPKEGSGYQLESWKEIRKKINDLLSKVGNINEDKLLGPFFISENVLNEYNVKESEKINAKAAEKFKDLFKSKVLMYLYEDVCKINPSQVFPKVKSKTGTGKARFSDVCDEFDKNGIGVFEE